LMVGTGPLEGSVKARIAETGAPVEVLGFRTDIDDLLEDAWGVGLFSTAEALTFTVQEAMWAGRAVVASDLPGIRYLVGDSGPSFADLCDPQVAAREGARAADRIRTLIHPDDPWPRIEAAYGRR
jgi:glycosyltransferase involved in cell wall biosynthesis